MLASGVGRFEVIVSCRGGESEESAGGERKVSSESSTRLDF